MKDHIVLEPHKHEVFKIETENSILRGEIYNVDIVKKPTCSCRDFMDQVIEGKPFLACKHMYYMYLYVFGLNANVNIYIHQ